MVGLSEDDFPTIFGRLEEVTPEILAQWTIYYQNNAAAYVAETDTQVTFTSNAESPHDVYINIDTIPYGEETFTSGPLQLDRNYDTSLGVHATQTNSYVMFELQINSCEGLEAVTISPMDKVCDVSIYDDSGNVLFATTIDQDQGWSLDVLRWELYQYTHCLLRLYFHNVRNTYADIVNPTPSGGGASAEARIDVPDNITIGLAFYNMFDQTSSEVLATVSQFMSSYNTQLAERAASLMVYPFVATHAKSVGFTTETYASYLALCLEFAIQEGWFSAGDFGDLKKIVRKSLNLVGYISVLNSGDFTRDVLIPKNISRHLQHSYSSGHDVLKIAAVAAAADDYNIYLYWG